MLDQGEKAADMIVRSFVASDEISLPKNLFYSDMATTVQVIPAHVA